MKRGMLKRGQKLYTLMCEVAERLADIRSVLEADLAADCVLEDLESSWLESIVECERLLNSATLTLVRLLPPKNKLKSASLEREMNRIMADVRKLLAPNSMFYSIIPEMVKPQIEKVSSIMKEYAQL